MATLSKIDGIPVMTVYHVRVLNIAHNIVYDGFDETFERTEKMVHKAVKEGHSFHLDTEMNDYFGSRTIVKFYTIYLAY